MVAQLKNIVKLIRGGNLIIVVLCMYFFQYFVLKPQFMQIPLIPSVDNTLFFLLTLGVVMITAAGYIINDFFDFEIDKEFKANRSVLGVWLSLGQVAFNKKNLKDSRVYYENALRILESTNVISNPFYYYSGLLQMASIELLEKNYDKSLEYSIKVKLFLVPVVHL